MLRRHSIVHLCEHLLDPALNSGLSLPPERSPREHHVFDLLQDVRLQLGARDPHALAHQGEAIQVQRLRQGFLD